MFVTVSGLIVSLKVAVTTELTEVPVASFAGTVALTVGGVVSGRAPVVHFQTKLLARGLPARSLAPVVMVAVYSVLGARATAGAKTDATPT